MIDFKAKLAEKRKERTIDRMNEEQNKPADATQPETDPAQKVVGNIKAALACARANKPGDRSDRDRLAAMVISDLEKTLALAIYAANH